LAQADYQQQLAGLSQDGDVAQELRNSRTWERERRKLDAAQANPQAFAMARRAVEDADAATLSVLLQELPSYLESRGITSEWVNPVVTQKIPALDEAQRTVQRAQQAQQIVNYDVAALRNGFTTASARNYPRCAASVGQRAASKKAQVRARRG